MWGGIHPGRHVSLCVKALHHQLKLINKDSSVLGPVSQPPLAVWSYLPLICHPSVVEHIVVLFIIIAFCIKHYICRFQCCQMKILCTQKEKKILCQIFYMFCLFFSLISWHFLLWTPNEVPDTALKLVFVLYLKTPTLCKSSLVSLSRNRYRTMKIIWPLQISSVTVFVAHLKVLYHHHFIRWGLPD